MVFAGLGAPIGPASPLPQRAYPIEARLVSPPAAPSSVSPPVRLARPEAPARVVTPVAPAPPTPEAVGEPATADAGADDGPPVPATVDDPAPPESPGPEAEPEPPAPQAVSMQPRALRELPRRVTLRYALQTGEGGFTLGYTLITWHASGDRYVLESVTGASGVTALLVRSSATQRSEGQITVRGLVPDHYLMDRGKGRVQQARFDWQSARLSLSEAEVDLPTEAQDLLNFPFHLALTLRGDEEPWHMAVTDGRRLREYAFRIVGQGPAPAAAQHGDALHLRGSRAGDGTLDVWLAPALHWLPVRIRTVDHKGTAMVLTLERAEIQ